MDRLVFRTAALISAAFVVSGTLNPNGMSSGTTAVLNWITDNFARLFVLSGAFFVAFSILPAASRYGQIKLGKDDDEPEFTTFSWVSMMFATGIGIGLMFYGVAEPLTHLNTPPLGLAEAGSPRAAQIAMEYTFTESIGGCLTGLPTMSFRTGAPEGADGATWLNGWTIFYWAWWMSWTPFVGMFIAQVSRGRTIRQFVIFVIAVPSLVSSIWFSTLDHFPLAAVTTVLAIFLIAIFFVTGADSASIVMGMLSQRGTEHPHHWLTIFWGVTTGAVAAVLLWSGSDPKEGLTALQTLVIIVAGPFMLILLAMCFSLFKALRQEDVDESLPPHVREAVKHAMEYDAATERGMAHQHTDG